MNYAEERLLPDYLDMNDLAVEYSERFGGHSAFEQEYDDMMSDLSEIEAELFLSREEY